jgi:secreted trypsin-like serine protease
MEHLNSRHKELPAKNGRGKNHIEPVKPDRVDDEPQVSGGEVFGSREHPIAASIGLLRVKRNGSLHCTATAISENIILTAAHCLAGKNAQDLHSEELEFVVSDTNVSESGILLTSLIPHPSYQFSRSSQGGVLLANDIGIAVLNVPFKGELNIKIPKNDLGTSILRKQMTFVGYGLSKLTNNGPYNGGTRRAVRLFASLVGSEHFEFGQRGKGICYGDSGGPAGQSSSERT